MASQRSSSQNMTCGSSELEWLVDVMVDGWMQGACVQVSSLLVLGTHAPLPPPPP